MDSTTGIPMLMLGTKWPSITSTCRNEAPARSTRAISSPRCAKSAERMEGSTSIMLRLKNDVSTWGGEGLRSIPTHLYNRWDGPPHSGCYRHCRQLSGCARQPLSCLRLAGWPPWTFTAADQNGNVFDSVWPGLRTGVGAALRRGLRPGERSDHRSRTQSDIQATRPLLATLGSI